MEGEKKPPILKSPADWLTVVSESGSASTGSTDDASGESGLPISNFKGWYDAIRRDDEKFVTNVLSMLGPKEIRTLVDTPFEFEDALAESRHDLAMTSYPLTLAVVYYSRRVARILLENGADICRRAPDGNNVIHVLIQLSRFDVTYEQKAVDVYRWLSETLPVDQLRTLLHQEDLEGQRPLERAASLGTLSLYYSLFNTQGVYLVRQEVYGAYRRDWYDVTEYESVDERKSRWKLSPVYLLLMCLTKDRLGHPGLEQVFRHPFTARWMDAKIRCNALLILLWATARVLFSMTYFYLTLVDSHNAISAKQSDLNVTGGGGHDPAAGFGVCTEFASSLSFGFDHSGKMACLLFAASLAMIAFDLAELVMLVSGCMRMRCPLYQRMRDKREYILHFKFYRVCTFLTSVGVSFYSVMLMLQLAETRTTLSEMWRVPSSILIIWPLLYFVQMIPSLGYFVISVQRMFHNISHFIIVYGIVQVSFSHAFINHVTRNAREGCVEGFHSLGEAYYTVVCMMLNMVDVRKYPVNFKGILYLNHLAYVFTVSILLLNFLIAIFSQTVAEVAEHKDLVSYIQRSSVAYVVELRCRKLLAFFYRRQVTRYFRCDAFGRVYVTRLVLETDPRSEVKVAAGWSSEVARRRRGAGVKRTSMLGMKKNKFSLLSTKNA